MADTYMKIERTLQGDIVFSGVFSHSDLCRVSLDRFDRMLLEDCSKDNRPEDWLLALETLFRKAAQQSAMQPAADSAGKGE